MRSLKKISVVVVVAVFTAIILSCNNYPKIVINTIDVSKTITSENVPSITETFIKKLGIIDTVLLVISDEEEKQSALNFYSLANLNKISEMGQYGISSVDFKSPKYDNQYYKKDNETYFLIPDANNYNIRTFSLNDAIKGINKPVSTMMLPPELVLRYNSIWLTRDSVLIGNYRGILKSKPYRFFFRDLKTKKMTWIDNYPKINFKVESNKLSSFYSSFCGFNDDLKIFASAMQFFKRVDFVGYNGTKKIEASFKSSEKEGIAYTSNILTDKKSHLFYNASYAGKKHFYAAYADATQKDYGNNIGNMQLHIFNWDGTLYKSVQLDQMLLGNFVIDENRGLLYIVNFSKKNNKSKVLKYNLN